jgi:hypothetical protein
MPPSTSFPEMIMASRQLAMHQFGLTAAEWSFSTYGFFKAHVLIERLLSLRLPKSSQTLAAECVEAEERQDREGADARLLVGQDYHAWKSVYFKGSK